MSERAWLRLLRAEVRALTSSSSSTSPKRIYESVKSLSGISSLDCSIMTF